MIFAMNLWLIWSKIANWKRYMNTLIKSTVNTDGKGGIMFGNKIGERYGSMFYRVNAGIVIYCVIMSGAMLPTMSYANAEEFATVVHIGETANINVHADSQPLAVQSPDTPAVVDADDKVSRPIDTAPDLSDVVQLETSKVDQHSQLDLAGSRDIQKLDVGDTASSVEFPQTVDDIGGDVDDDKPNVDLGDQPVAVSNAMIEQVDAPLVAVASVKLAVINTADAHSQASNADGQLKDASNDAASEETGLPYAVVLALLALIGLVPAAPQ